MNRAVRHPMNTGLHGISSAEMDMLRTIRPRIDSHGFFSGEMQGVARKLGMSNKDADATLEKLCNRGLVKRRSKRL